MKFNFWKKRKKEAVPKPAFPDLVTQELEIDGVTYYYLSGELQNYPFGRAQTAFVFRDEMVMRCSFDFVQKTAEATLQELNSGRIGNAALLQEQLLERRKGLIPAELVYKYASVIFWDANESPYSYDWTYNAAKIKRWKEAKDAGGFFLTLPLKAFLPDFELLAIDLPTYLKGSNLEYLLAWERIFGKLLPETSWDGVPNSLRWEIESLLNSSPSNGSAFSNTMNWWNKLSSLPKP